MAFGFVFPSSDGLAVNGGAPKPFPSSRAEKPFGLAEGEMGENPVFLPDALLAAGDGKGFGSAGFWEVVLGLAAVSSFGLSDFAIGFVGESADFTVSKSALATWSSWSALPID